MSTKKASAVTTEWVGSYQEVARAFRLLDGDRTELLAQLNTGLAALLAASHVPQSNGKAATHVSLSNECGVSSSQIGRDLVAAKYLQDKPLADAYQVKLITDRGTSLVTMLAAADLSALLAVARAARPAAVKAAKEAADAKAAKDKAAAVKAATAKTKADADAKAAKDAAELAAKNAATLAAEIAADTAKAVAELEAAKAAADKAAAKATKARTDTAKVATAAFASQTAAQLEAAKAVALAAIDRQERETAKAADAAKAATPAAPPAATPTPRTGGPVTVTLSTFAQQDAALNAMLERMVSEALGGKVKQSEWLAFMGRFTPNAAKAKAVSFARKTA
jgi:hypothetical protein